MTTLLARHMPVTIAPLKPDTLIWLLLTLSVSASTLPALIGEAPVPLASVLAVVGSAGCAWFWLFTRMLFRPTKPSENRIEGWTIAVLAAVIGIEGTSNLMNLYGVSASISEPARLIHNTEAFICIGALMMVFVEVFAGYTRALPGRERRFRQIFSLTFGALIGVTLIWTMRAGDNSLAGNWQDTIFIAGGLFSIIGTRLCLAFRRMHPLSQAMKAKSAGRFVDDSNLAERIEHTLQRDRVFATPDLKVSDLAEMIGEQDYKVTQCITGALGYRNFNHMVNSHRIASAREALTNPEQDSRPILSIAFDCGFNSIGPFNRAFKEQVGMTPRDYRAAAKV